MPENVIFQILKMNMYMNDYAIFNMSNNEGSQKIWKCGNVAKFIEGGEKTRRH
jgi:hypothetical protein